MPAGHQMVNEARAQFPTPADSDEVAGVQGDRARRCGRGDEAAQGVGLPPHAHPWGEAFYVIEGAVAFQCGAMARTVVAGGFVHVPAGTVHSFRYARPTARVLGITSGHGAATMFTAHHPGLMHDSARTRPGPWFRLPLEGTP